MYTRILKAKVVTTSKSVLLLGPRQVGKTTMMRGMSVDLELNLADEVVFLNHASDAQLLTTLIEEKKAKSVFIDEIQRLPKLLNTIQMVLDSRPKGDIKFYLTGSSARKLKRGGANLLPGRVVNFLLGTITAREGDYKLSTMMALEYGTLPEILLMEDKRERERLLKSYAANYIKEEIRAEALVRSLDSFTRFFQESIKTVSQFVDYTKLSKMAKISRHAIPRYFEILEDTLIGERVFPLSNEHHDLDLIKHPRFFLFDNGVYNGVLGNFTASSDRVGTLSEQLIFSQLRHSAWALELEIKISSFRTRDGVEVDFIVELEDRLYAIEVKNSDDLISDDLSGLKFFKESIHHKKVHLFVFHMGRAIYDRGDIAVLPWQEGLRRMGL